jgi:hypothetical protein
MQEVDLSRFSLVLVCDDDVIYSSEDSGLRPLFYCIKKNEKNGCILFDRVIGLAAAKLIAYSGMIDEVYTKVVSKPAQAFLQKEGIAISGDEIVDNIMRKDGKGVCPMEKLAMESSAGELFKKMEEKYAQ